MKEIWINIKRYENIYQVSNLGRVRRLNKWFGNRYIDDIHILKQSINKYGYCKVTLQKNGKKKMFSVHRLVAETFISNPSNLPQVNHKDGNKLNNNIWNLEWCTSHQNILHAVSTGLRVKTTNKKTKQYDLNRNLIKIWDSARKAELNLKINHITDCCNHKRKTAGGYIWEYVDDAC